MPKTALVCGFYNRPNLVRRTIRGLAAQTDQDVQFYLFDDGSSDNTADVIERELDLLGDHRFKFSRHSENVGLTAGLKRAVAATDSDYVAIHDAGDYSFPTRIEQQSHLLDSRSDVVVAGSYYVNFVEDVGIARLRCPCADNASLESTLKDTTFTHGEVMFRRDSYEKVGGYQAEFRFSQDNDLWLRLIQQGRFYTVKDVLYIRAVQFGGISYNPKSLAQQSAYYVLGKLIADGSVQRGLAVDILKRSGDVFEVLSKDHPMVQRVILRAALRSMAFGAPDAASKIAQTHLAFGASRLSLMAVSALLNHKLYRRAVRTGWRLFCSRDAEKYVRAMHIAEQ